MAFKLTLDVKQATDIHGIDHCVLFVLPLRAISWRSDLRNPSNLLLVLDSSIEYASCGNATLKVVWSPLREVPFGFNQAHPGYDTYRYNK